MGPGQPVDLRITRKMRVAVIFLLLASWQVFSGILSYVPKLAMTGASASSNGEKKNMSPQERARELFYADVERDNESAFRMLRTLLDSKQGWTFVAENQGVSVEKRFLAPGPFVDAADARAAGKHACVKSHGIVNAPPEAVFRIFQDRARVREYNEHVTDLADVHFFPKKGKDNFSKITYAYGPKYGPFKPRDFLSVVHFQRFANDTFIILNRPAYVPEWRPKEGFVRATVLLAGNVIEPYGKTGQQSYLTQVAHVNPGGGADTPAVAWIINKLCAVGPPTFIRKLERAAQRTPLGGMGKWSPRISLPALPAMPAMPAFPILKLARPSLPEAFKQLLDTLQAKK